MCERVVFTMTKKELYIELKKIVKEFSGIKSVLDLSNQRILVLKSEIKRIKGALKRIKQLEAEKQRYKDLVKESIKKYESSYGLDSYDDLFLGEFIDRLKELLSI